MRYVDPDGRFWYDRNGNINSSLEPGIDYKVSGVTKFVQTMFTEELGFSPDFSETACNATAALNIFSIQYFNETGGKSLTIEEGIEILKYVAFNSKYLDEQDATVYDLAPLLNDMIKYYEDTNKKDVFKGKFGYSNSNWLGWESNKSKKISKFVIDRVKSKSFPEHFTNEISVSKEDSIFTYYDTYDGVVKTKNLSEMIDNNNKVYYWVQIQEQ